jgi:hypothetical protein
LAVCSAWTAVVLIHPTNGAAAAVIDADAGPDHESAVSAAILEL